MAALPHVNLSQLARRAEMPAEHVRRLFDVLTAYLEEDVQVRIRDFGNFTPRRYKARTIVTPLATVPSGKVETPGGRKVTFKMAKSLRVAWSDAAGGEG